MGQLVAAIWGEARAAKPGERAVGKGRVIWGRPVVQVLGEMAGGPDFEFVSVPQFAPGQSYNPRYDFFHRRTPDAEIYFVANPRDEALEATARFRVTGRRPQLWDSVTGRIRPPPDY
jgi:(4-O-methyl)-D-glucuronate---lignin esterase